MVLAVILFASGIVVVPPTSKPLQAAAPIPEVKVPFAGVVAKVQFEISEKFSV